MAILLPNSAYKYDKALYMYYFYMLLNIGTLAMYIYLPLPMYLPTLHL